MKLEAIIAAVGETSGRLSLLGSVYKKLAVVLSRHPEAAIPLDSTASEDHEGGARLGESEVQGSQRRRPRRPRRQARPPQRQRLVAARVRRIGRTPGTRRASRTRQTSLDLATPTAHSPTDFWDRSQLGDTLLTMALLKGDDDESHGHRASDPAVRHSLREPVDDQGTGLGTHPPRRPHRYLQRPARRRGAGARPHQGTEAWSSIELGGWGARPEPSRGWISIAARGCGGEELSDLVGRGNAAGEHDFVVDDEGRGGHDTPRHDLAGVGDLLDLDVEAELGRARRGSAVSRFLQLTHPVPRILMSMVVLLVCVIDVVRG